MAEEIINGTGTEGNESGAGSQQETKTYTEEEVAKLIQAEADRRTNQALAKQKRNMRRSSLYHLWMSSSVKKLRHR